MGIPQAAIARGSRAAVHVRTQELAGLAGRAHPRVTQADYEQAKREITGETDVDRQNAVLDAHAVAATDFDEKRDVEIKLGRPR